MNIEDEVLPLLSSVMLLCLISLTPSSIKNYLKIPFVLCKIILKKHFLKLLLYFTKDLISFVLEDVLKFCALALKVCTSSNPSTIY